MTNEILGMFVRGMTNVTNVPKPSSGPESTSAFCLPLRVSSWMEVLHQAPSTQHPRQQSAAALSAVIRHGDHHLRCDPSGQVHNLILTEIPVPAWPQTPDSPSYC